MTANSLNMEWRESGGPPVAKPERQGFGSRLVAGILGSFGGKIDARFEPSGLVCHLYVELSEEQALVSSEREISESPGLVAAASADLGIEKQREAS